MLSRPLVENLALFAHLLRETASRRALSLVFAAVGLGAQAVAPVQAACPATPGDVTADGAVDVLDVECSALLALAAMEGESAASVSCLVASPLDADETCDGTHSLADLQVVVQRALNEPLPPEIDTDGSGCFDACEFQCGNGTCEASTGETCLTCPNDCGDCANNCCDIHEAPGCVEPEVESCVCAISSFCCDFFWDESCVELAKEFCEPTCFAPQCAVAKTPLQCGTTVYGSTKGAPNQFSAYPCGGADASGGDAAYVHSTLVASGVQIEVKPIGGGVANVHLLPGACSANACTAGGAISAQVGTSPDAPLYVVVDSPAGQETDFALTVTCPDDCDVATLCGDNECGNITCAGFPLSCGTCSGGLVCSSGECVEITFPGCPGSGDCFSSKESPGCDDVACCANVCSMDAFCCSTAWDSICASAAFSSCNSNCGDGTCSSIDNENCQNCVADCGCAQGSECDGFTCQVCDAAELCGALECGEVFCGNQPFICGNCGPQEFCDDGACALAPTNAACPSPGSCFAENTNTGCNATVCCNVVCALDSYCCATLWDDICADEAALYCSVDCGNGVCEPDKEEDCSTCPNDCTCQGGLGCLSGECIQCTQAAACEGKTCGTSACGAQTYECGTCGDGQSCVANTCIDVVLFPGCPGQGDCFVVDGTPGCADPVCCSQVCAQDPFCCNTSWDLACSLGAAELCAGP